MAFIYRLSDLHTPSLSKLSLLCYSTTFVLRCCVCSCCFMLFYIHYYCCNFGQVFISLSLFLVIFMFSVCVYMLSFSYSLCVFFVYSFHFILLSNLNFAQSQFVHCSFWRAETEFIRLLRLLALTIAGVTVQRNLANERALICHSFYSYCAISLEFNIFCLYIYIMYFLFVFRYSQ